METLQFLFAYFIASVSVSLTGYLTLYRPAVKLIEEILDGTDLIETYTGITGFVLWNLYGIFIAPLLIVQLITGKNDKFIEEFASTVVSRKLDDIDE